MDILDRIMGRSKPKTDKKTRRTNDSEYKTASRLDDPDNSDSRPEDAEMCVQCININQNTDTIQTKDELRNGNIVIADISNLGAGLSEERVLKDLQQAVDDVNGDIAMQNTDQHVILTPNGVGVSRRVL